MSDNNEKSSDYADKVRETLKDLPPGYCSAQLRNLIKSVYMDALDGFAAPSDPVVFRARTVRERMK